VCEWDRSRGRFEITIQPPRPSSLASFQYFLDLLLPDRQFVDVLTQPTCEIRLDGPGPDSGDLAGGTSFDGGLQTLFG
jgi:hypothetical protein